MSRCETLDCTGPNSGTRKPSKFDEVQSTRAPSGSFRMPICSCSERAVSHKGTGPNFGHPNLGLPKMSSLTLGRRRARVGTPQCERAQAEQPDIGVAKQDARGRLGKRTKTFQISEKDLRLGWAKLAPQCGAAQAEQPHIGVPILPTSEVSASSPLCPLV